MNRLHTPDEWIAKARQVLPSAGFGNFDQCIIVSHGEGSHVWDEVTVELAIAAAANAADHLLLPSTRDAICRKLMFTDQFPALYAECSGRAIASMPGGVPTAQTTHQAAAHGGVLLAACVDDNHIELHHDDVRRLNELVLVDLAHSMCFRHTLGEIRVIDDQIGSESLPASSNGLADLAD